ncbi:MAG TPA: hypothetical protein VMO17_08930 [Terriglobia bacterium]|nr:hypothetical protein [Terriglobia bacterium]
MKPGPLITGLLLISALVCSPAPAPGEEIILKDGQRIVGTIVGYEKDMFRVETDYGIALIRKDKVASIQVSKPEPANSPAAPAAPVKAGSQKPVIVAPAPEAAPVVTPAASPVPTRPPPIDNSKLDVVVPHPRVSLKPSEPPPPVLHLLNPARLPKEALAVALQTAPGANLPPAPPLPSHPVDVPMPAPLQEHVDGSTYINDTFQFSMFKPPDWKVYEGVPKETGSGIMAMGTEDEQTLLIVDREVWSGTPKLNSEQVDARLRQTYQDYQPISVDAMACDGQSATRQTFAGVLDGAEWHGVAVHFVHGTMVIGITGLTSSESFEFQEAVFNKIIKSFHFTNAAAPAAAPPTPIASP